MLGPARGLGSVSVLRKTGPARLGVVYRILASQRKTTGYNDRFMCMLVAEGNGRGRFSIFREPHFAMHNFHVDSIVPELPGVGSSVA